MKIPNKVDNNIIIVKVPKYFIYYDLIRNFVWNKIKVINIDLFFS
jgi:hypothetical protein